MSIYANNSSSLKSGWRFFLTHTQSSQIINSDIIFVQSEYPQHLGLFWYPHLFHIDKMMSLNTMFGMLPTEFGTQWTEKGSDTLQMRLLVSQKVIKWTKEGAILIILPKACFILMYLFVSFSLFCRFSCPLYFLRNKFTLSFILLSEYFHV